VIATDKVYRNDGNIHPFAEHDPLGGADPYSASKAATELITASLGASFLAKIGVAVATARAGNVIGGGDWSEDRLVPDVWRAVMAGEPLRLRHPQATRPWQHVLEALAGYLRYAERLTDGADVPRALNFGPPPGDVATVAEVADAMLDAMQAMNGWVRDDGEQPEEAQHLSLDPMLAMRSLGWRPRLDARQAVQWTAEWYRAVAAGTPARAVTRDQIAPLRGAAVIACLACGAPLTRTFVDLGSTPLANSFVPAERSEPDPVYPLHARVCDHCLLVQVEAVVLPTKIFSDYAYFSSYSDSWLAH